MAIQDDFSLFKDTTQALTWKSSGGSKVITCTSLAAAASRLGDKSPTLLSPPTGLSTAVLPVALEIQLECKFTSAPAAGGEVSVYLAWSDSATAATDNPAGLLGADAAGPNADTFGQLMLCGSLVASNNLGTAKQGPITFRVPVLDIAFSPVINNGASVAFSGTPGDTILTVVPLYRVRST